MFDFWYVAESVWYVTPSHVNEVLVLNLHHDKTSYARTRERSSGRMANNTSTLRPIHDN